MKQSSERVSDWQHLEDLRLWCRQPLGHALAMVEQQVLSDVLSDVFGYHLVLLDPPCDPSALEASRIMHRVLQTRTGAGMEQLPALIGSAEHLPLESDSIDAFVLPHVLEHTRDPHQVLREIDRCLLAEGHLIVLGFNPYGWWGLRKMLFGWRRRVPWSLRFVSLPRLKDWLSLLGFDTVGARYLFAHPPWHYGKAHSEAQIVRQAQQQRWPLMAAAYVLVARKRVATLTPIKPRWRPRRSLLAGVAETGHGSVRRHG